MISVIVPVYNAEKTLERCVDSILNQSFQDWELLLINDGSIDGSLSVCNKYAQIDGRIKVFNKPNGGVSSARNIGIDNTKGDWLTFVDADDYVGDYYFDEIPDEAEDLIVYNQCSIENYNNRKLLHRDPVYVCHNKAELYTYLGKNLRNEVFLSPWGKFFKRNLIDSLRFDVNQKLGEDTIFVQSYLRKCDSLRVSAASFYCYYDIGSDFCKKYSMPVPEAKLQLFNIFDSYIKLGTECQGFVSFELELFRKTCSEDLLKNPRLWYCDKKIQRIHKACKEYDGWKGLLKYNFFKIPLLYRLAAPYLK